MRACVSLRNECVRKSLWVCVWVSMVVCVCGCECSYVCAWGAWPDGEASPQAGGAHANRINTH